jgi:signal transduction histidine kinase
VTGARPAALPLRPAAEPGGGADAEPPPDALRAAAAAVQDAWTDERGDALDPAEVSRVLEWLASSVEAAERGDRPERGGPAASTLGRHLFERLRAEVVRVWRAADQPPEPEAVLALLEAFERVREAIDPDWSEYFNSRLTGPDGLDLVVGVAHDLRSPLTSVLFLADTLGRGRSGPVTDLQQRQLRLIYSASLGLSSLTSDVIELARGGDQLIEKEVEAFSLAELLETLRDIVRPIAEEKGIALRYIVPASHRRVGRPHALSRVLLNLTTNALKFTDEGFVEITSKARGLSGIEFSVRDTGRGMSNDALSTLYQPFRRTRVRGGRSGYHFSGTGLGLAMCRKLVEAMGSQLRYESRPDWGTLFHFELDLPPAGRP